MPSLLIFILAVVAGFIVLCLSASRFVEASSTLAVRLGMPLLTVGITVVAFGTSAPELIVSTVAAYGGSGGIAIGNVVGSNIVNIGLIFAVGGLIAPVLVKKGMIKKELGILIAVTLLASALLMDGSLSLLEGAVFFVLFFLYSCYALDKTCHAVTHEKRTV